MKDNNFPVMFAIVAICLMLIGLGMAPLVIWLIELQARVAL